MTLYELTEGQTADLVFEIDADGVAVDLTGLTVTLVLKDCNGDDVSTSGDIEVTTAESGVVTYSPTADDFVADLSPYFVHFKVVDGAGKVAYFPSGRADTILVYPE